nr:hypothetical protein [Micromonospora sp. DSM 115978]
MPDQQPPPINGHQPDALPAQLALQRHPQNDGNSEAPRYVAHIPFNAATLGTALDFGRILADFLAFIPHVDQGETTITAEGNQQEHYRVICNKKTGHHTRCPLVSGHADPCDSTEARNPSGPEQP